MSINFPTSIDSFVNPASGDTQAAVPHATQHANANDAITALETKVGVNNSAVTTTHDYKLSGVAGSDKAVSKTGTETLTNKTLTSPKINVGSDGTGDMYYRDSGGNLARLPAGTTGQIIAYAGGIPTTIANPSAIDARADVQVFTANGTWTKPTNAKIVEVIAIGAGGGGGSGAVWSSGNNTSGGSGGGGGAIVTRIFQGSALTSTVAVTVGTSAAGTAGGASSFGTYVNAYGGGKGADGGTGSTRTGGGGGGTGGVGANGSTSTVLGGVPATTANADGIAGQGAGNSKCAEYGGGGGGAAATNATGSDGGSALFGAGGGGGGAGLDGSGSPTEYTGGVGGVSGTYSLGGGGAAGAVDGGAGGVGTSRSGIGCGDGGGGGGSQDSGTGGVGGQGGTGGGGGGGGGAGKSIAGAGGAGGRGEVIVITYF